MLLGFRMRVLGDPFCVGDLMLVPILLEGKKLHFFICLLYIFKANEFNLVNFLNWKPIFASYLVVQLL